MRHIIAVLLLLASAPAAAEWVLVNETDEATYYLDPATVRVDGTLRRVWIIHDLKQRGRDGGMSSRQLNEYDCKEDRFRGLSLTYHSEPMAKGNIIWSDHTITRWLYTPPESVGAEILKLVCVFL